MISAVEMATLRATETLSFTTTATVYRKVAVTDTSGGFTNTYTAAATYPCSFGAYPVRPREREAGERIQLIAQWSFVFPASAMILATDRITVGTRTFEVVSSGIGSDDVVLKVICTELL